MAKYFDKIPIVSYESYVGYGKHDLDEMSKDELKKELLRTEREIESFKDELASTKITTPSYVLKERIEDAKFYKKQIEYAISKIGENKTFTNENNSHKFKVYKDNLRDYDTD